MNLSANANAVLLQIVPSLDSSRLTLRSDDGAVSIVLPARGFPHLAAAVGQPVVVILGLIHIPPPPEPDNLGAAFGVSPGMN